MAAPKYSIVIPTKERAHTLRACLQACLNVDYSDYEIIVSDNHSSEETAQVVREFASPKIRYYRTERALSMCKNWEVALSHTRGEWITFIGDDDGIFPYALRQVDRLLTQVNTRLIQSHVAVYMWPDLEVPKLANYLNIPLSKSITFVDGAETLLKVLNHQLFVGYLPSFYHGFVHRSLVDEAMKVAGKMFVGYYPDHFPGFVFTYLEKRFVKTGFPLTIAGHSSKSNGGIASRCGLATSDFVPLCIADGLESHPWVPAPRYPDPTGIFASFLLAKERFFPTDNRFTVDRKDFLTRYAQWYARYLGDEWGDVETAILASLVDEPNLQRWFTRFVKEELRQTLLPHSPPSFKGRGYLDGCLHLDATAFGVSDICSAIEFCEKVLSLGQNPVDYKKPLPPGRLDGLGIPRPALRAIRGVLSIMGKRY